MSNDLRVLIDASVDANLADEIRSISAIRAKYAREIPEIATREDVVIMNYAKSEDRIVITTDTGFGEHAFPICTHPGIIQIRTFSKSRSGPLFKEFILSGNRKLANQSVTVLTEDAATIKQHGSTQKIALG